MTKGALLPILWQFESQAALLAQQSVSSGYSFSSVHDVLYRSDDADLCLHRLLQPIGHG